MSFSTLIHATARRRAEREASREDALARTVAAIEALGPRYGVTEAYLFGSLVRPGRFSAHSDIDVAVAGLGPAHWAFAAELSRRVGREVDLVDLEGSRFAQRIRREGVRWTPTR